MEKLIFICSPYRGDTEGNIKRALEYCREVSLAGAIPIAPHAYFTSFLMDSNSDERARGLRYGQRLLSMCDEMWVYSESNISEGMREEIEYAIKIGIPVKFVQQ